MTDPENGAHMQQQILRKHSNETVLTEQSAGRAYLLGAAGEVEITTGPAVRVEVAQATVDINIGVNLGVLGNELVVQLDLAALTDMLAKAGQRHD